MLKSPPGLWTSLNPVPIERKGGCEEKGECCLAVGPQRSPAQRADKLLDVYEVVAAAKAKAVVRKRLHFSGRFCTTGEDTIPRFLVKLVALSDC